MINARKKTRELTPKQCALYVGELVVLLESIKVVVLKVLGEDAHDGDDGREVQLHVLNQLGNGRGTLELGVEVFAVGDGVHGFLMMKNRGEKKIIQMLGKRTCDPSHLPFVPSENTGLTNIVWCLLRVAL